MSLLSLTCIDGLFALLYWLVSGWFDIRWPGSLSDLLCPKIVLAICLTCYPDRLCVARYVSMVPVLTKAEFVASLYTIKLHIYVHLP